MKVDVSATGINLENEIELFGLARKWADTFFAGGYPNTGWVSLPAEFDRSLLNEIKDAAEEIRRKCDLLIVVGIGGSYLGAKAVIDALDDNKDDYPEIMFAGYNMSTAHLNKVLKRMRKESVCLCVISKSGSTTEPLLTYSVLKEKMIEKYGMEEAVKRIYVITDESKGTLRREAEEKGYRAFAVPENVGGRYSVLSSVGLLPIAAAGHDIESLLHGAADMSASEKWEKELLEYAVCRVALERGGKQVEIFECFETNLLFFGEWLKQLFCESEGKDGKGIFTTCLCFSRDLHSVGQFLQQGRQMFFETLIRIRASEYDFEIPESAGEPYAGKTMKSINECAEEAVVLAHKKAGIPIVTIELPVLDEYNIGKLIYFFEMSCAISAAMTDVDPFNQPGVEAYKREMKTLVQEL